MNTKFKRLMSIVLVCVMVLSLVGTAFAAPEDTGDPLAGEENVGGGPADTGDDTGDGDDDPSGIPTPFDVTPTYYVANAASGGTNSGDGSETKPFLRISDALDAIEDNLDDAADIVLLSNIPISQELDFTGVLADVTIKSKDGESFKITYEGEAIGNASGIIKVTGSNRRLSFDNITLCGSSGDVDARVIYVSNGAVVTLTNTVVFKGKVNNAENGKVGGAAICVGDKGTLNVNNGTIIRQNETNGNGGAIYASKGSTVVVSGKDISITSNIASNGAGIYVEQGASLTMEGQNTGISFTNNKANVNGGVMAVEAGASAKISGVVSATGHTISSQANNIYLARNATLDINGSTKGANIGITCENEENWRLVSNQVDGYTIATEPAADADETYWADDCGQWDIRYMVYNGVPGLYLYYHTLDAIFGDINTLTSITGPDINDTTIDYLEGDVPNTSVDASHFMTVPQVIAKNGEDYVVNFTCNESGAGDQYRIPTADQVVLTSGGRTLVQGTDYTYEPDFSGGTAKLTLKASTIEGLTAPVKFQISAEKYFFLTLKSEGPLYNIKEDSKNITGQTDATAKFTQSDKTGTTATYTVTRNNVPLTADGTRVTQAKIDLYKEGSSTPVASVELDANGKAVFNGLENDATYYPVLCTTTVYRIIGRDELNLNLSTLAGQNLDSDCEYDDTEIDVTYSASSKTAATKNISADTTVLFKVQQAAATVTFHANKPNDIFGNVTKGSDTLTLNGTTQSGTISKTMEASATTYGTLATATLQGYDFVGWFTAKTGGEQVTEDTPYGHDSVADLYAHWTARNDTTYTVKHWVEIMTGGANPKYVVGTTPTKTVSGVTYYLYDTVAGNDGTSDILLANMNDKDLKTMTSTEFDWWTRAGLTAKFPTSPKVEADGSAIFDIFYDRNRYEITFSNPDNPSETIDPKEVPYGSVIGDMPTPTRPGYEFDDHLQGGWEDENGARVNPTDTYIWAKDITVTATWNPKDTTQWAIVVMVQDISANKKVGLTTYTKLKSVLVDNDNNPLTGTSDTSVTMNINDFDSLITDGEMIGFHYVGYNDTGVNNPTALTTGAADGDFTVYVKPTDEPTADDLGYLSSDFDGGIAYLYFDRNTRKVEFEDGQGNKISEETIIYGGTFEGQFPEDPVRDGYDFDGWKDPDGNEVDDDTPAKDYTQEDDTLIIIPIWTARQYNLTYIPGDNAAYVPNPTNTEEAKESEMYPGGYIDPNKVTYGKPIGNKIPTAKKPGHEFEGWHIGAIDGARAIAGTLVNTATGIVIPNGGSYEATRPLYAQFTPHRYTLMLHPGSKTVGGVTVNGEVTPTSIGVTYGETVDGLPTPTLEGYRFVSWCLDPNSPTTKVSNGNVWTKASTPHAIIHLYATWVPSTYTYTFNLNDNLGSTRAMLTDTSIDYVEVEYGSVYGNVFEVEAVRDGYNFMGWSLTADGDVLTPEDIVNIASDATLYAIWQPKIYDVKLVLKGGTITDPNRGDYIKMYGTTATYDDVTDTWTVKVLFDTPYGDLPVPVKANTKFNGWLADAPHWNAIDGKLITALGYYTDFEDSDGIILTAVLEPYFTFTPGDGAFEDGSTDDKVILQSDIGDELPKVEKDGYDFQGWEDEDGNEVTLEDVKNSEEPMTLYPILIPEITFNGNGGKVNGKDTDVVPVNKLTSLPTPVRPGYTFDKWVDDDGNTVTYNDIKDTDVPVNLTARYVVNATFNANGGTIEGRGSVEKVAGTLTALPNPDNRSNYSFNGWFTAASGGTKVTLDTVKAINTPTTYYAQWTYSAPPSGGGGGGGGGVSSYTVTFNSNGGSPVPSQTTSGKVTKPDDPTKDFNSFAGWYKDEALTQAFDFNKDRVNKNTTLYAKWTYTGPSTYLTTDHVLYINGFPDNTVRPESNITRAEVATIFYRLLNDNTRARFKVNVNNFPDVNKEAWYNTAISTLSNMGILFGRDNGMFDPDANITRAEFATICARFDSLSNASGKTFSDLSSGHWAYKYIMSATAKGWIVGFPDGTFRPEASITRAEAVTLINRVLGRDTITVESIMTNAMKKWPDNADPAVWYYLAIQEASNAHDYRSANGVETWTSVRENTVVPQSIG